MIGASVREGISGCPLGWRGVIADCPYFGSPRWRDLFGFQWSRRHLCRPIAII